MCGCSPPWSCNFFSLLNVDSVNAPWWLTDSSKCICAVISCAINVSIPATCLYITLPHDLAESLFNWDKWNIFGWMSLFVRFLMEKGFLSIMHQKPQLLAALSLSGKHVHTIRCQTRLHFTAHGVSVSLTQRQTQNFSHSLVSLWTMALWFGCGWSVAALWGGGRETVNSCLKLDGSAFCHFSAIIMDVLQLEGLKSWFSSFYRHFTSPLTLLCCPQFTYLIC